MTDNKPRILIFEPNPMLNVFWRNTFRMLKDLGIKPQDYLLCSGHLFHYHAMYRPFELIILQAFNKSAVSAIRENDMQSKIIGVRDQSREDWGGADVLDYLDLPLTVNQVSLVLSKYLQVQSVDAS